MKRAFKVAGVAAAIAAAAVLGGMAAVFAQAAVRPGHR